jgi:valyl-tRNA synthetase
VLGFLSKPLKPTIKEKRWDHRVREAELLKLWEAEGLYKPTFDPSREFIVIDTPPPYASGKWHVGGASHFAQIDMVARYFRLKGYNVIVPFYADRNGLPVEVQVEKLYGVNAKEMAKTIEGRRRFLELCKEFLDKAEAEIVGVWRRLGCSFDYWSEGTDSPRYRAMTQATFIELYKRGLIYEAERPVRWCPRCGTTLAEAEVEYEDEEGHLYYVKFKLAGQDRDLIVATTRPELLRACAALAYNPRDERYRGLAGLKAIAPIYGHEMVILEHPAVDPGFGTGLMMICSYGDEVDVRLFNELGLKPRVIITEDGRMNEEAGPIAGLPVRDARARMVELLRDSGYLEKVERIVHRVPRCWRCKTPLQIIHRRELFLKQLEYRDDVKRLADSMEFKPEMHKKRLFEWIDSLTMDWPISRDRYYGTEIPLWTCTKCGSKLLPEPGRYYRPWEETPWDKCPVCGAPREYIVGDTRVFDTWFDSSITPLYVTRWAEDKEFYERVSNNILRPQGHDIIRTWLYYTILRVYQLTGKPAFRWVRITGMGLDPTGRPMHKSLGNIIDPDPVVEEYGADAFRFWAAVASRLGYDYRFDQAKIKTGRLLVTKLWNIARFASTFPYEPTESPRTLVDLAFLALYEDYVERIDRAYSDLDVYEPGNLLYELAWDVFASHYIELVKERAYNRDNRYSVDEQRSAWITLHRILKGILVMLSPIMPFVTDDIHRRLYGDSVHKQAFPKVEMDRESRERYASIARKIIEVNKAVWAYKRKNNIRIREGIGDAVILVPQLLERAARDLEALHKTPVRVYIEPPANAIKLTEDVYILKA